MRATTFTLKVRYHFSMGLGSLARLITSEVFLVKVYVRGQGNMTILETGEYQATVPDKQCKGGAAAPTGKGSGIEAYPAAESNYV